MDDLISKKMLLDALRTDYQALSHDTHRALMAAYRILMRKIEHAPTVDAVPVVRCKDCKHRYTDTCTMQHTEWSWDEDDGSEPYDVENTVDSGFCYMGEPEWIPGD